MLAKDTKPGAIIKQNEAPLIIESVMVQSPSARGGATLYKFRARNLVTKQKVDLSCKGTDNLEEADFQRREATFMFADAEQIHFLDQEDYNQWSLLAADIEEEMQYVTEDLQGILVLIYDEQCVGIQLPATVELKITECDPGVKGNSATSRNKPAKLETGLTIQVPEYLKQDQVVKIDTRTGAFLSRA
ncbi:elongation factor P [Adhaeretor mobilis]|uniref:Elongation factor P-like protein n=1 Tax=Adhaeretor mobilis TaxID=1930276 RepID=A0A517MZA2_9BACT|nr:elongation factor P [Adhaeretor mobilis]QDT00138.1 Elongation factor P-like protein [Adhaeretor mobilis]